MRDKLIWKFLGSYIPLILLAIIVFNFFVSFSLRNHFEQRITEQLYQNSLLVSAILKENILEDNTLGIQRQVKDLAQQLDTRVTVIDKNGVVLGDSQKDFSLMENHADRPEIIEAMKIGRGESNRFSDTLNYNMKYVAVPLRHHQKTIGVVRLAMVLKDVDAQIRIIYREVLIGGMIAAILMMIVGYYISKSITDPISQMRAIAERLSNGDFTETLDVKSKDELGSLAMSFNKMAKELESRIERLKAADQVRTDFVANVSHELKTPLTSIKGYVETLQDGALDDKENVGKFLNIINKHVDSLTHIVDDLLVLSEIESEKDRLHPTEFDLKAALGEIIFGFGHNLKKKNLNITFESQEEQVLIVADKGKIEQVFVNLIDNAAKYTEEKGSIVVSLYKEKDSVVVSVKDSGIGIPPSEINRVFERFYRIDKARSREAGGTGLGLAIVKHVVSLHQGEVRIESVVHQGTTVFVILPIV